ncbi:SAM-dependent methyltransferase [Paenibacillus yonginensis]|uniref:SAM-dependent methyltransferase n=1 Tax=Paenibacillus yonginensis TaxID=1462996 RepID=A0A1B1MZN3_9BACL|nr:SAM-dependent methyltransferase [Paenibacillus yonginensis]ANS74635.1 SAM-dependent methyltransferase [Paenibacillus yonginensis]
MNEQWEDRPKEETGTEREEQSSRWICTANHGFSPYAQEELRRTFGSLKSQVLESGEVMLVTLPASADQVLLQLQTTPLMFLRHMFPVQAEFRFEPGDEPAGMIMKVAEFAKGQFGEWLPAAEEALTEQGKEATAVAVQVRKSGKSFWQGSALELKDGIEAGWDPEPEQTKLVVRDADFVLSVYAAEETVYAGISTPAANLSDWNGGAVRFQREEGQISRAKFKLLEAERTFGIGFSEFRNALDIGAAPGGWTSFLLERGLTVTAVDPADMNPELLKHPNLTYIKKNADSVAFDQNQFDLLVCDMSWSPKLTARLVIDLLYSLVPGGTAVVTIKLLSKKPLALIKEIQEMYTDARMQIIQAKQLFHNRDEITLYMIKY